MTASRRSSWRLRIDVTGFLPVACIGLIGWALLAGSAAAQVGEPTQLLPKVTPDYGAAPPAAAPDSGGTADPVAPQGFEIDTLDAVGAGYAGTLEPGNGGLGFDMWRGTDRAKLERLLPLLKPPTSPLLAELTRRLLLSSAAAPAGRGGGRNLLPVRAEILGNMGLVEDAIALLRLVPDEQRDAETARQLTELSWRAGDVDGGCAVVQDAMPRVPVDEFWQQASVFCQLRAGQTDAATLGLDLLREQGEGDTVFYALADALGGASPVEIPPLTVVSPLYLAMARAAGVPVPRVAIHEPPPLMLALIAEDPDAPIESRLAAAETAAAAGVLSPRHLAASYTAEPADPGTLDRALDSPEVGATPETRAILYQAALRADAPEQRARLLQKALAVDVLDPNYWARLKLYLPLLADIPAAPELSWFAADAARHLFAGGRLRAASEWIALLQGDEDAPKLAALEYLAGEDGATPDVAALLPADPSRAARLRALFAAVEEPADPSIGGLESSSLAAVAAPVLPRQNVNLWLDLGDAAAKNRVGEAVLLTLVGLDATGLAAADPQWLGRGIASLRRIGLAGDARRLAVEAAIVNGL
jgi:hypothetical protein